VRNDVAVDYRRREALIEPAPNSLSEPQLADEDPTSALHASCVTMRAAGTRFLARAQAEGLARSDINGVDLFALIAALAWLSDQAAVAPRVDHLFGVVTSAILTNQGGDHVKAERRPAKKVPLPKKARPRRQVTSDLPHGCGSSSFSRTRLGNHPEVSSTTGRFRRNYGLLHAFVSDGSRI
jgi:hypothetical protein